MKRNAIVSFVILVVTVMAFAQTPNLVSDWIFQTGQTRFTAKDSSANIIWQIDQTTKHQWFGGRINVTAGIYGDTVIESTTSMKAPLGTFTTLAGGTANAQTNNVTETLTAATAQIGNASAAASHVVGNATINGNLGIGTGSPSTKVHSKTSSSSTTLMGDWAQVGIVLENADTTNFNRLGVDYYDGTNHLCYVGIQTTNHSTKNSDFLIATKGASLPLTEKVRITGAGEMVVGATVAYATNLLSVYGYSAGYGWNVMSSYKAKGYSSMITNSPSTKSVCK